MVPLIAGGGTDDDDDEYWEPEPFELTDELDLHTFHPRDVSSLIPEYIDECLARGFPQVRIIHGKGKGVLRRIVHAALERHPRVESYKLGDHGSGAWGATLAVLKLEDDA